MSGTGKKRPPLVADKRYGAAKPKPKAKPKAAPARRKPAARKRTAPARKRGPIGRLFGFLASLIWRIFRFFFGFFWRGAVAVTVLIGLGVFYYAATLPPISELVDGRARGSVTLQDQGGRTFAWRGEQFGGMITANGVSPHLRNAVVATEDKRFYGHMGVSPRGIASAVRINLRAGRGPLSGNGGSTITQQVAKLLCLGQPYVPSDWDSEAAYEADCRRTTIWRKVKEATYAMALEVKYTKDDVLTIYLNRAYLGSGSRGFEAAANQYFGHGAEAVTPAEAAMLAGSLKAPSVYNPANNLQRAQDRAATVIKLMHEQGYLSESAQQQAWDNPATLSPAAQRRAGGYFADWVMKAGPEFFTRNTTEDVIIKTTLDQRIQTAAEDAMQFVFDTKVRAGSKAQAAIVVMDAGGAVRAMVGGRETRVSGAFNRAIQARRQPGSAFKPFVYATALELGATPFDMINDAPLCLNIPGSGEWCPQNYTKEYEGPVTLTQALVESLNTPAVRLFEQVGGDNVRTVATQFGIQSDLALGPALALGSSETTLLEITGAYAGILNGGSSVTPYGLVDLRFIGDDAPLMETQSGIGERVIREDAARQLVWMMKQVVEQGTGKRAQLEGIEVAGKTGTTQAARDAWFVGFTGDYVAGVWMGYDDNSPLTGVTGSGLPADIWRETMSRVTVGQTIVPLPMTVPVAPQVAQPAPAPAPATAPQQQQRGNDPLGDAINGILNDLFGGGN